jgi:PAS domain S-box-containing protein
MSEQDTKKTNYSEIGILHATHRILEMLEKSKANSEDIIDNQPDIFGIITKQGRILKGSESLAKVLGCHLEECLDKNIGALFKEETTEIFLSHMNQCQEKNKITNFELILDKEHGLRGKSFLWSMTRFGEEHPFFGNLYSIFGRDVTELRNYQKQLSEIFASIPISILQLDKEGKVFGPFSKFTNALFPFPIHEGVEFLTTLEHWCQEHLNAEQVFSFRLVKELLGGEEFQYELSKYNLPKKVFLTDGNNEKKCIGFNYQPVVYNGIIEHLLILMEDRTELEKVLEKERQIHEMQDKILTRITELRQCDLEGVREFLPDLFDLAKMSLKSCSEKNAPDLKNHIHTIKGNARSISLKSIAKLAHELEDFIAKNMLTKSLDWSQIQHKVEGIKHELEETNRLLRCLTDETQIPNENKPKNLKDLENYILNVAKTTSDQLGKEIDVVFELESLELSTELMNVLKTAFLHLITNAIDHGIELPEERVHKGKLGCGKIVVKSCHTSSTGPLNIKLCDDGRGVNIERIKEKLLENKMVSPAQLSKMSEKEIINHIWLQGFSTKKETTETSGRGVGLDAVASSIQSLKGTISLDKNENGIGTCFEIHFDKI